MAQPFHGQATAFQASGEAGERVRARGAPASIPANFKPRDRQKVNVTTP